VIHSGIYYPSHSLKAQLCVEGNKRLYEICEKNSIPCKKIGKFIIANNELEIEILHKLYVLGKENGLTGLSLISKSRIKELEPAIKADFIIYSKETGIVDSHRLIKYFEKKSEISNVIITYNSTVISIEKVNDYYSLTIQESNNELM